MEMVSLIYVRRVQYSARRGGASPSSVYIKDGHPATRNTCVGTALDGDIRPQTLDQSDAKLATTMSGLEPPIRNRWWNEIIARETEH